MPGDVASNGINCIPGHMMALFFPVSNRWFKPGHVCFALSHTNSSFSAG